MPVSGDTQTTFCPGRCVVGTWHSIGTIFPNSGSISSAGCPPGFTWSADADADADANADAGGGGGAVDWLGPGPDPGPDPLGSRGSTWLGLWLGLGLRLGLGLGLGLGFVRGLGYLRRPFE
eukprot:scaffold56387_cov36-Phaeocystis_antarctica.AAC.2